VGWWGWGTSISMTATLRRRATQRISQEAVSAFAGADPDGLHLARKCKRQTKSRLCLLRRGSPCHPWAEPVHLGWRRSRGRCAGGCNPSVSHYTTDSIHTAGCTEASLPGRGWRAGWALGARIGLVWRRQQTADLCRSRSRLRRWLQAGWPLAGRGATGQTPDSRLGYWHGETSWQPARGECVPAGRLRRSGSALWVRRRRAAKPPQGCSSRRLQQAGPLPGRVL